MKVSVKRQFLFFLFLLIVEVACSLDDDVSSCNRESFPNSTDDSQQETLSSSSVRHSSSSSCCFQQSSEESSFSDKINDVQETESKDDVLYSSLQIQATLSSSSVRHSSSSFNYLKQFQRIGMLGGSLVSGVSFYTDSVGNDFSVTNYDNAINQIIAKKNKQETINFSSGGFSTKSWLSSSEWGAGKALQLDNKCDVYLVLFGGNDIKHYAGKEGLGTIDDVYVDREYENLDTYYGNYSRIVSLLKGFAGDDVPILALTYSLSFNSDSLIYDYNQATRNIAELYSNVFLVDLEKDEYLNGPEILSIRFKGHYPPEGYRLIAERIEALINVRMGNDVRER